MRGIRFPSSPAIARTRRGGWMKSRSARSMSRLRQDATAGGAEADDPALDRGPRQADGEAGEADPGGRHDEAAGRPLSALQAEETDAGHAGPHAGPGGTGPAKFSPRRRPAPISTRGPAILPTPIARSPAGPMPSWAPDTSWPSSSASGPTCGSTLREILQRTGKIVSTRIGGEPKRGAEPAARARNGAAAHPAAGGGPRNLTRNRRSRPPRTPAVPTEPVAETPAVANGAGPPKRRRLPLNQLPKRRPCSGEAGCRSTGRTGSHRAAARAARQGQRRRG